MRAGYGVRPKNNFQSRRLRRALHQLVIQRQNSLHGRKAFFCITGRAEILFFVEQIIFDHQPCLWIQIRPFRGHQFQIVVGRHGAVLDLSAAGQGCRAHCIFVSVNQRAEP